MNTIEITAQPESLYTLKFLINDIDELPLEVKTLVTKNKQLQHAPVVLEINNQNFQANELAMLVEILTQNSITAVGIRSNKQELIDFAKFSGLALFVEPKPVQSQKVKIYRAPKIVNNRVYSFEQIVAKNSDLVLLDEVGSGAEIMAFGNISAYKETGGRLFAGMDGDESASIFVQSFKAQLVSIAGIYREFNTTPHKLFKQSVRVDLTNGNLKFQII